jgi:uncharacterized protein (DUF433 family)
MQSNTPASFERITINPAVLNGQPIIRGTWLSVRRVVEAVALYQDRPALLAEYPGLTDDDIEEALRFAALAPIGSH